LPEKGKPGFFFWILFDKLDFVDLAVERLLFLIDYYSFFEADLF